MVIFHRLIAKIEGVIFEDLVKFARRFDSQLTFFQSHRVFSAYVYKNAACRFYSIPLPLAAKSNSTRLRFWQPQHEGKPPSVSNGYFRY